VERVAAALQNEIDTSLALDPSLPGIAATVLAPRIGLTWSGASGMANPEAGERLTPDHAFRIASITKPFTSTVALRLFEQGRFDLFAPITRWLDARTDRALRSAGYRPEGITAYHLLTHASGLRDHAGADTRYGEAVMRDPARCWTHAEQIEFCMAEGAPIALPGLRFSYSDTGYVILAELLERTTGSELHALIREVLDLGPHRFVHTHFERHESPPPGQRRARQSIGEIDVATIDCSCDLFGGGGLISTTGELAVFIREAALGRFFDQPSTLPLALTTPTLLCNPPKEALHSALMRGRWVGGEPCWMHGGFWGAVAAYGPGSDIAIAVSFNQARPGISTAGEPGNPDRPSIADRLIRIARQAALQS
jgi:D-alanyl-D-alanine carboxypeptidase